MTPEFPMSPPDAMAPEPLRFTGTGSEYFRIWIVNLALTIVTLGVYSAWAKVRKLQYFHRHTQLAGSSFDYHGRPGAILKGRIIALVLLGGSNAVYALDPLWGVLVWIPIAAVLPWLLVRSLAFRLHNTSWRGLRFRFDGSVRDGYVAFLLWPLAALVTLGVLWPRAHRELKRYQFGHSLFGRARFRFDAPTAAFYRIYVRTSLLFVVLPILGIALLVSTIGTTIIGGGSLGLGYLVFVIVAAATIYLALFASGPYLMSQLQNLVWNGTELPPHRFASAVRPGPLLGIVISNLLLTVVTLGLYRPFGMIRLARYRVSCVALQPGESLDRFVGERAREIEAVGEEVGEFLDIDIAL